MANILLQSPSQINIVRTAIPCPDSPREVGDGMEMDKPEKIENQQLKSALNHPNSGPSSGYSTPVLPISPRLSDKRSSFQRSISLRSNLEQEDSFSYRESLPSPIPSEALTLKNERFLIEEKMALKDHLQIQVQVNQELRRLLVASIGEDMGFHYERIATEKAQIEMENEELKKKIAAQDEEAERLNISCDVWRSKFLASRVQCDESQETLIKLQRRQREMDTAIRGLIREHRLRSEHLEETYDTLKHLHDALQWGKKDSRKPKKNLSKLPADEECLKLSHMISSQLLGIAKPMTPSAAGYKKYLSSWKRMSPGKSTQPEPEYEVKATLAEKYVTQLLREGNTSVPAPSSVVGNLESYTRPSVGLRKSSSAMLGRFHPNAKHDNITLACCSKCKGDIHVI